MCSPGSAFFIVFLIVRGNCQLAELMAVSLITAKIFGHYLSHHLLPEYSVTVCQILNLWSELGSSYNFLGFKVL